VTCKSACAAPVSKSSKRNSNYVVFSALLFLSKFFGRFWISARNRLAASRCNTGKVGSGSLMTLSIPWRSARTKRSGSQFRHLPSLAEAKQRGNGICHIWQLRVAVGAVGRSVSGKKFSDLP
jgi:hypothetical protein